MLPRACVGQLRCESSHFLALLTLNEFISLNLSFLVCKRGLVPQRRVKSNIMTCRRAEGCSKNVSCGYCHPCILPAGWHMVAGARGLRRNMRGEFNNNNNLHLLNTYCVPNAVLSSFYKWLLTLKVLLISVIFYKLGKGHCGWFSLQYTWLQCVGT